MNGRGFHFKFLIAALFFAATLPNLTVRTQLQPANDRIEFQQGISKSVIFERSDSRMAGSSFADWVRNSRQFFSGFWIYADDFSSGRLFTVRGFTGRSSQTNSYRPLYILLKFLII